MKIRGIALAVALAVSGCNADGSVDAVKVCEVVIAVGQAVLHECK